MIGRIYHVGLTVTNMDKSISFYRDILGLRFEGEILMTGEETNRLFQRECSGVRVAYLNGSDQINAAPVELIQFLDTTVKRNASDLFTTSISEVCFFTDDIDLVYQRLINNNVECLSSPQYFDFTAQGFGKSKALYFKDPDGIILELMQPIED